MVIILAAIVILPGANAAGDLQEGAIAQMKADFDSAMAQPLEDRITLLENLEQEIDDAIYKGDLTDKAMTTGLYFRFRTQQELAKYPESCLTYAVYILSIKDYSNTARAHSVFLCDVGKWSRQRDYAQCASICEAVADICSDERDILATALYHTALSKYWMNGTKKECMEVCVKLIAKHLDSPWRPKAMRLLANSYAGYGKFDAAVGMLDLLKEQYPDTRFARYADMRVASYYEYIKGDPQKALEVYQRSLVRYPDHIYAPYIHRQIKHLQKIIEEQLILDALEGIGKADIPECKTKSVIVKSVRQKASPVAVRLDGFDCVKEF